MTHLEHCKNFLDIIGIPYEESNASASVNEESLIWISIDDPEVTIPPEGDDDEPMLYGGSGYGTAAFMFCLDGRFKRFEIFH